MNPNLTQLQPYPFEKLMQLKAGIEPPANKKHIALSIGEPKHDAPAFVLKTLVDELDTITNYPVTKGIDPLRTAMANWVSKRFQLTKNSLSPQENIIPVNGTREALFAFTQVVVDSTQTNAKVLMPNPFYQIYEGAALIAGAEPYFLNCEKSNGYLPNFGSVPDEIWQQCQLLFLCSPGNPTGAVLSLEQYEKLIGLADKFDFVIASDECYSELYFDEQTPPPGLLEACAHIGRNNYERCMVFHSLSKRSNLPGLRSGFAAGDKHLIKRFLHYRTYHGCAMPLFSQHASITAWNDESHVLENRNLYRQKFDAVLSILKDCLEVTQPNASFYLWPKTPIDDAEFARGLFAQENVTVLPGSYLARDTENGNPGQGHIRMALVAPLEECIDAAERIKNYVKSLG